MRVAAAIAVLALIACGSDMREATQVSLQIDAAGTARDANELRVRVLGGAPDKLVEQDVVDIPVEHGWPVEIVIEPKGGDVTRSWQVEAWGLAAGKAMGAGTVHGTFDSGNLVERNLVLKAGTDLGSLPIPTVERDGGLVDAGDAAVD